MPEHRASVTDALNTSVWLCRQMNLHALCNARIGRTRSVSFIHSFVHSYEWRTQNVLDAGNAETEDLVTDLRKLTGRQAVIRMSYR